MSIFPLFSIKRKRDFIKLNTFHKIKDPCTKCSGECHNFDIIQCDVCLGWTHLVCTSLNRDTFLKLGDCSDKYICSKRCEMKVFPFNNITNGNFSSAFVPPVIDTVTEKQMRESVDNSLTQRENTPDDPIIQCDYLETCDVQDLGITYGSKDLTAFHSNVASLPKNLKDLEELFRFCQKLPDIIGVTETRILENGNDSRNTKLEGYNFEHCPTPTDAGGAGVYISKQIEYEVRDDLYLDLERCEDIWIQIKLHNDKKVYNKAVHTGNTQSKLNHLIVGIVYRHPGSQFKEFGKRMCKNITQLNNENSKFAILGDININLLKYNIVGTVTDYLNNVQASGCLSYINKATRVAKRGTKWQSSCIDHFYSNIDREKTKSYIVTSNISDHYSIFVQLNQIKDLGVPETDIYSRRKFLTEVEVLKLNSELENALQSINFNDGSVSLDEKTSALITIYNKLRDKYFSIKKLSRKEKTFFFKPWISSAIQVSMKTRDKLQRKSLRLKTDDSIREYKKYKNHVNRLQKIAYNNFHSKKVTSNFKNKKKLWQTINEIGNYKKNTKTDIKCLKKDGMEVREPRLIAECLNDHFNTIGKNMAQKFERENNILSLSSTQDNYILPNPTHSIFFENTSLVEIRKLIKCLDINKAPGSDGISNYMIKKTINILAPILVKLFNDCMKEGIFPSALKIASIVPIHKGGPKEDPTNYRPISLLPQFGKLFEKIIEARLSNYLDKHKYITKNQYGFRKNYSTELAIADIQNTLLKNLDDNKFTCTIFLDLAKAFDTVDHKILLKKLEKYGIRGKPLLLLKSYLSNRQHLTKFLNDVSELKVIDIGVPQGSILGPLLFLLFINDLPSVTNFNVKLFADDTFLSLEADNYNEIFKKSNIELKKISRWLTANKLTLNVSKTKYMIIHRRKGKLNVKPAIKFNGKKLEKCTSYKYLGIFLDEKLNWKVHIKYLCEKLSKLCGIFSKLRHCCSTELMKVIYHALFSSHLQYCNFIWGNATDRVLMPLVCLQDKLIKIISFAHFEQTEIDHLYNDLSFLKLKDIHLLSKAKFVYKFKNSKLPPNFYNFLSANTFQQAYPLRSRVVHNDFKCVWGRTNYGSKMVQYEGALLWNSIPQHVRVMPTIKEFAKNYKTLLIAQY